LEECVISKFETRDDAAAWFNKGDGLEDLGRSDEAIKCYDRALEIDPQYEWAWIGKGFSLASLDRLDEALECFDKALEINPQYADAWFGKACAEDKLDQNRDTAMSFHKFIEVAPASDAQQIQAARQRLRELEGR
jgi:tetratricopeptide (TPR) repeat protein